MIDRYALGANHSPAKDDNGEYVLFADHAALLDAIGGGSVNGQRLIRKPIEQHRAEFESTMRLLKISDIHDFNTFADGQYVNSFIRERWLIWAHARNIAI